MHIPKRLILTINHSLTHKHGSYNSVCVCSEYRPELPAGKHSQFAIEHGPVEIVDLPSYKMVDLSSSLCNSLPEGRSGDKSDISM